MVVICIISPIMTQGDVWCTDMKTCYTKTRIIQHWHDQCEFNYLNIPAKNGQSVAKTYSMLLASSMPGPQCVILWMSFISSIIKLIFQYSPPRSFHFASLTLFIWESILHCRKSEDLILYSHATLTIFTPLGYCLFISQGNNTIVIFVKVT